MTGMSQVLVGGAVALAFAGAALVAVAILLLLAGLIELAVFYQAGVSNGAR